MPPDADGGADGGGAEVAGSPDDVAEGALGEAQQDAETAEAAQGDMAGVGAREDGGATGDGAAPESAQVEGDPAAGRRLEGGFGSLEAEALASVASEFDDFLADMGAVKVSEEESKLAIRDATIAELQRNLADLRPLGDALAETEKARLALEEDVAQLSRQLEEQAAEHERQLSEVQKRLEKAERAGTRLEERLAKAREKFTKRDRVASERWHEMRKLQRERRELREKLEQVVKDCARTPADLARERTAGPRPDLAALFDPEPGEGDRALPRAPDSASIQA